MRRLALENKDFTMESYQKTFGFKFKKVRLETINEENSIEELDESLENKIQKIFPKIKK